MDNPKPDDFDVKVQCEEVFDQDGTEPTDGDWMDADALASAGWGVDEDYGGEMFVVDEW